MLRMERQCSEIFSLYWYFVLWVAFATRLHDVTGNWWNFYYILLTHGDSMRIYCDIHRRCECRVLAVETHTNDAIVAHNNGTKQKIQSELNLANSSTVVLIHTKHGYFIFYRLHRSYVTRCSFLVKCLYWTLAIATNTMSTYINWRTRNVLRHCNFVFFFLCECVVLATIVDRWDHVRNFDQMRSNTFWIYGFHFIALGNLHRFITFITLRL